MIIPLRMTLRILALLGLAGLAVFKGPGILAIHNQVLTVLLLAAFALVTACVTMSVLGARGLLKTAKVRWYGAAVIFVVVLGTLVGAMSWRQSLSAGAKDGRMAASQFIRNANKPGVIVFVHGIFGDSISTWTNTTTGAYWPTLLTQDPAFTEMDIYVYKYPSPKIIKTYSINELAENMRLVLEAAKVFDYQAIIFLSHSMGGLVTRALLLKYRDLAQQVKVLHFFATPTTGSEAARLGKLLSSNPQLGQMIRMDSATFLADQQRDWLAANFAIPSYCAYEIQATFGMQIVEQQSATNLCNQRVDPIDTNHIDIVKPMDATDTPYLAFKAVFLKAYAEGRLARRIRVVSARPMSPGVYILKLDNAPGDAPGYRLADGLWLPLHRPGGAEGVLLTLSSLPQEGKLTSLEPLDAAALTAHLQQFASAPLDLLETAHRALPPAMTPPQVPELLLARYRTLVSQRPTSTCDNLAQVQVWTRKALELAPDDREFKRKHSDLGLEKISMGCP